MIDFVLIFESLEALEAVTSSALVKFIKASS